jgi:hypothetical protein
MAVSLDLAICKFVRVICPFQCYLVEQKCDGDCVMCLLVYMLMWHAMSSREYWLAQTVNARSTGGLICYLRQYKISNGTGLKIILSTLAILV